MENQELNQTNINQENISCEGCSKCCEYIAVEIDKPETEEDFENIKWFLLHKNVKVFIQEEENNEDDDDDDEYGEESENIENNDNDNIEQSFENEEEDDEDDDEVEEHWFLQFHTPCKELDENGLCKIYGERPEICKEHSPISCEKHGEENNEKMSFEDANIFWNWVEENYNFEEEKEENSENNDFLAENSLENQNNS